MAFPEPSLLSQPAGPNTAQLGTPVIALPWVLVGKAQRLRPLYQYINYCNPELNQAGRGTGRLRLRWSLSQS